MHALLKECLDGEEIATNVACVATKAMREAHLSAAVLGRHIGVIHAEMLQLASHDVIATGCNPGYARSVRGSVSRTEPKVRNVENLNMLERLRSHERITAVSSIRSAIAVAALTLCGCTMIPRYERPPAPVAERFPGAVGSSDAAAANLGWRDFFHEARLVRLIELALAENRDLRVAALNVQRSRAEYRVTRSSSLPTIDATGVFSRQHVTGTAIAPGTPTSAEFTGNEWSASVGVSAYELDFFGRIRSLNRQALEQYFATAEAQRSAQISLVAEVATQYFALRQAEEQLKLAGQTVEAVQESYNLNKVSFDAGQIAELDLRTSEGQVQTAQTNVVVYERQLAQAVNALVLLVGQPLPPDLPAPTEFDAVGVLAGVPAGLPSDLVQRRPDILEAEHTLKAANANIGAARAAFFPTVTLTGSVGSVSPQLSKLFGSSTGQWSFSPQISLPLFAGGKNLANLDAAGVSTRTEVANYEKAIQTAFREVADALIAHSTYATEVQVETDEINTQQRRLELATARYRQGEDSYLNVLSAQQDLYSVQQSRLQAQFNSLSSQISLYQALGGGWK
jgi:multidrug efflux system outer membrane protein